MSEAPALIYPDTSVIGGVEDDEFSEASRRVFDLVESGAFRLALSDLLWDEIEEAPQEIVEFYLDIQEDAVKLPITPAVLQLSRRYLQQKVVRRKHEYDALHVATATVHDCDLLVSWNFKHIANWEKIRKYNAVNLLHGYNPVEIRSPREVIEQ